MLSGKPGKPVRLGIYHPDNRAKIEARWLVMKGHLALSNTSTPSILTTRERIIADVVRAVDVWFEECERHIWVSEDYSEPTWLKGIRGC